MQIERGIVIKAQSGFYTLVCGEELVTARLRGRLKRGRKLGDLVAVGDWVQFVRHEDGKALIEEVEERTSQLSRMAPAARGDYEQIIIANLDQALFVFACADPAPKMRMLDRFLVIAEKHELSAIIIANKSDLVSRSEARGIFGHYPEIGYPVLYTSALKNKGIGKLKKILAGKISVFTGPSGVGKSKLLNVIQPELKLDVSEVSSVTGKGRHTTVVREMFALKGKDNGYVADTPGLKSLGLWDIEPQEFDAYFPEMRELVPQCKFSNCSHFEEPGCAILAALELGEIHPDRYESYVRLRLGDED